MKRSETTLDDIAGAIADLANMVAEQIEKLKADLQTNGRGLDATNRHLADLETAQNETNRAQHETNQRLSHLESGQRSIITRLTNLEAQSHPW